MLGEPSKIHSISHLGAQGWVINTLCTGFMRKEKPSSGTMNITLSAKANEMQLEMVVSSFFFFNSIFSDTRRQDANLLFSMGNAVLLRAVSLNRQFAVHPKISFTIHILERGHSRSPKCYLSERHNVDIAVP